MPSGPQQPVVQPLLVWHDQQPSATTVQPPVPSWQFPAGNDPHAPEPEKLSLMNSVE
jgi:hypothetical protein